MAHYRPLWDAPIQGSFCWEQTSQRTDTWALVLSFGLLLT